MSNNPSPVSGKKFSIYVDGAARGNPGDAGIGVLIIDSENDRQEIKKFLGKRTNNQAEYTALITALETFKDPGGKSITVYTDSQLVANQINGNWKVKHPDIRKLHKKARDLIENFDSFRIIYIPREQNTEADRLANQSIDEYFSN